jgi:hypothetical protein
MFVWIQHRQSQCVLRAQRQLLDMSPKNQRYWTGEIWSPDPTAAKLFDDTRTAKQYREAGHLCEQIPVEWQS